MKFIAAITHRSVGDSDGRGWPTPSVASEFESNTPIEEIWNWYQKERHGEGGLLEIFKLE